MKLTPVSLVCAGLIGLSACKSDPPTVLTDSGTPPGDMSIGDSSIGGDGGPDGSVVAACPSGVCDLLTNVGCDTGTRCSVTATAPDVTLGCLPVGTGGDGVACASDSECLPAFICGNGHCIHMCCSGDSSVCPTDQFCGLRFQRPEGGSLGIGGCIPNGTCNLSEQTGCDTGLTCKVFDSLGHVQCAPPGGSLAANADCDDANDMCGLGLQCLRVGASGGSPTPKCWKFCDVAVTTGNCGSGEVCANVTLGTLTMGLCQPSS